MAAKTSRLRRAARGAIPVLLLVCASGAIAEDARIRTYEVQPRESQVRIHVGTSGLFGFLGHEHLVEARVFRGHVLWNAGAPERSAVELVFEAESLAVLDPELPEEKRARIQDEMQTEVLSSRDHPQIVFEATSFRIEGGAVVRGEPLRGTLEGTLTLHGVTDALTVPVSVTVGPAELRGQGEVVLKGTRFGIQPVRAGGGTVKTKDALRITFELVARPAADPVGPG